MDSGITTGFFFGKKILKQQEAFDHLVNNLYSSIKADPVEDEVLKAKVNNTGKDLTVHLLCKLLNTNHADVMVTDSVFCQRALYAHHAQNAYSIKKQQLRNQKK